MPPGTYTVSATFATEKKRSKEPIVRTLDLKAGSVYYASFKTSFDIVFNHINFGKSQWVFNFTENVADSVRKKVAAARDEDIKDKAGMPGLDKIQAGEWGGRIASVPVPGGLGMADVGACVVDAMKARKWEIVSTTDSTAIGQYWNDGWTYYLCIKYDEAAAELYGPQVSKNWSEGYKALLTKQLNAKVGLTGKK
ncbi:hypothetical protein OH491_14395 [Termitidicoccus mucosus]